MKWPWRKLTAEQQQWRDYRRECKQIDRANAGPGGYQGYPLPPGHKPPNPPPAFLAPARMKVAAVLDRYTVAVTGGLEDGVKVNDRLLISGPIVDPESGQVIGMFPDIDLKVIESHPRFCVAETVPADYEYRHARIVNIGDDVKKVEGKAQ